MAHVFFDRVRVTTTTTGTGTYTVGTTPATGCRAFTLWTNNDTTVYCCESQDRTVWEVGIGTVAASGTTIARTTLIASSTGSAINWTAGTRDIYCCPSGSRSVFAAVSTRASAAIGTAYQPSTTRDTLVVASVQIETDVAGDGKLEMLCDSANPPTTVRGTFRIGTALTIIGGQLSVIVPAGHYWKLLSTDNGGTPTYSIVGNVQEISL